jgi:hypothetical protein
MEYR